MIIERGPTSFGAYLPDLPGCVAVAETAKQVKKDIREAIAFHIESMRLDGEEIPDPASTVDYVDVDTGC